MATLPRRVSELNGHRGRARLGAVPRLFRRTCLRYMSLLVSVLSRVLAVSWEPVQVSGGVVDEGRCE
jgi:hypothetical protein